MLRRSFLKIAGACCVLAVWTAPAFAQSNELLVFAAASMKNALDDTVAAWKRETGKGVKVSYAASSALAKQIESGAPADLFISADADWMKYVADKKLIRAATRVDMLGNRIVLVAAKDDKIALKIAPGFDLAGALGPENQGGRLAMANVDSVPAGKYGKAALQKLGVWGAVEKKVAQADDVRATLLLVSRGEAPLGIVYQTDAAADANVKIVDIFPADTHPAIIYPAAVLADSKNPDAEAFLAYMRSAKAKPFFEKQGFSVLD